MHPGGLGGLRAVALAVVSLFGCILWPGVPRARAQPIAGGELPASLRDWVPWVLYDSPDHNCALQQDGRICRWPAQLSLTLDDSGGRFAQRVQVDAAVSVPLPGGDRHWPSDVQVDGRTTAVLLDDGWPSVRLPVGSHQLQGTFHWPSLPERLAVPPDTAQVALSLAGKPIVFPRRDEQGELWLTSGAHSGQQGERLDITVHRRIADGVPLRIDTRLLLRVSGPAREVTLGRVLLPQTTPLSMDSQLPARLEPDGTLRLQVRAGTYRVTIAARSQGVPQKLAYHSAGEGWPEHEVWVWVADEALRQVELSGGAPIDPARTELADDWRGPPAFVLGKGQALALSTTRRGEPDPPPNRVELRRELWLDLDGRGYTVRDHLTTDLKDGFRLDLLADGELGHVAAGDEDLLITQSADGKHAGVELRNAAQSLVAEWRAPHALGGLPAVGWSEDVQALSASLYLPPGYDVLSARGVDEMRTWMSDWNLFGFFFVLIVSIALGRLFGRSAGLLALISLLLCHHEAGAPQAVWLWLIGFIALLRVLPAGRARTLARIGYWASLIGLLLVAIPFASDQVIHALYPQAEAAAAITTPLAGSASRAALEQDVQEMDEEAPPAPAGSTAKLAPAGASLSEPSEAGRNAQQAKGDASHWLDRTLSQDPDATVQTGPGVPRWHFRSWQLSWTGPVDRAHKVELLLISPRYNRVLSLLRVLLVGLLIAITLRELRPGSPTRPASKDGGADHAATAALLVLLSVGALLSGLAWPERACAQPAASVPSQALLDELKTRLLKPPACGAHCASIESLSITVQKDVLALSLRVHAGALTSVALPGPAQTWVPAAVSVDSHSPAATALRPDGFLHVRMEPGTHLIEAQGPLPPSETLTLSLRDRPHFARVNATGWKVDGVREDGRVEGALQLSRLLKASGDPTLQRAVLPPWLLLERSFELGSSWRIRSTLRRISPTGTPLLVRVALLSGESMTDSTLEVVQGQLQVSFGRDDEQVQWTSSLSPRERIVLKAAEGQPWSERWTLRCGPIWHCTLSGLTPIHHVQQGRFEPMFAPWPGEQATIAVGRPRAAQGQSVTIDRALLEITPGTRMTRASLRLEIRSSRGGTQRVSLPQRARVQSLQVAGTPRPVRLEDGKLTFTLEPGEQAADIEWQEPQALGLSFRAPHIELSRPLANAEVRVHLPRSRWLLWVVGPAWGPAILFWPYLLLVIGVGLALGRVRHTPLRTHAWVLLGLGLTQIPAAVVLVIVGWFFAMQQRGRMRELSPLLHDAMQLALLAWTLATLGCLYAAVHAGLLTDPDMQVTGGGSSERLLRFYVDRSASALPAPVVTSAPLWVWRLTMLAWSLWLAASLVKWLPWAFGRYCEGGLWKRLRRRDDKEQSSAAQPPPAG